MRKNLSELLNIRGTMKFEQKQAEQLILKTMEDIKKFEKNSQKDQIKINGLKGEISSNKGAAGDKNSFTEQRDSLNYPRNYHDALKNTETIIRLINKGEV